MPARCAFRRCGGPHSAAGCAAINALLPMPPDEAVPAPLLATQCKARDIILMPGSQDFAADPRNAGALVNLNGRLVPRGAATVSIFDGGFVVGGGVWGGLRLHRGALLFL